MPTGDDVELIFDYDLWRVLVSLRAIFLRIGMPDKIMQNQIQTRHEEKRYHSSEKHALREGNRHWHDEERRRIRRNH